MMTDNLKHIPAPLRESINATWQATIVQHGDDPGTRAQAASHEAGRIVVGAALGESIVSSRVDRCMHGGRAVWTGYTESSGGPVIGRWFYVRREPGNGLHLAATHLAGFAGECATGLSHPSSSIDERAQAQQICMTVDKNESVPEGTSAAFVWHICHAAIRANRAQFERIQGALMRATMLSARQANQRLEGLVPVETTWGEYLKTKTPAS